MGAASSAGDCYTAKRGAARSSSRCSIGSRTIPIPLYRPDGVAVSRVIAFGFTGKYHVTRTRERAPRAGTTAPLSQHSSSSRHARARVVAPLARPGRPPQSAHSVRALVGRRGCGAGDPLRSPLPAYYASLATLASPGTCGARESGSGGFSLPPAPPLLQDRR